VAEEEVSDQNDEGPVGVRIAHCGNILMTDCTSDGLPLAHITDSFDVQIRESAVRDAPYGIKAVRTERLRVDGFQGHNPKHLLKSNSRNVGLGYLASLATRMNGYFLRRG
jgi:hypothetical protein